MRLFEGEVTQLHDSRSEWPSSKEFPHPIADSDKVDLTIVKASTRID
jgi:hypothetical protein